MNRTETCGGCRGVTTSWLCKGCKAYDTDLSGIYNKFDSGLVEHDILTDIELSNMSREELSDHQNTLQKKYCKGCSLIDDLIIDTGNKNLSRNKIITYCLNVCDVGLELRRLGYYLSLETTIRRQSW